MVIFSHYTVYVAPSKALTGTPAFGSPFVSSTVTVMGSVTTTVVPGHPGTAQWLALALQCCSPP
ncbi:MAG: hypothetical protein U9N80_10990 [Chloroflexota bacterium]|nr:hypothetical protein [Chloroflexota bacterium]